MYGCSSCAGPRLIETYPKDKLQHFLAVASPSSQAEPASLNHQQLARLLHQRALSTYKQGHRAAQAEQEATNDTGGVVDALVALATFCDKALRAEEEQGKQICDDSKTTVRDTENLTFSTEFCGCFARTDIDNLHINRGESV